MDGANGEYYARAGLTTIRKWQCWVAEGDGCAFVVVSRARRAREEIYFGEGGVRSATRTVLLYISLVLPSMSFLVSLSSSLIHSLKVEGRI